MAPAAAFCWGWLREGWWNSCRPTQRSHNSFAKILLQRLDTTRPPAQTSPTPMTWPGHKLLPSSKRASGAGRLWIRHDRAWTLLRAVYRKIC
jgi:hypothetical protein